jgi:hypothetical protein
LIENVRYWGLFASLRVTFVKSAKVLVGQTVSLTRTN